MSDTISFTVSDIPPAPVEYSSDDPTCEVCGKPLTYAGRGRKPKYCEEHRTSSSTRSSGGSGRRSARDVEAAMAALGSAHTSLDFLFMLTAPDAAIAWGQQREALDDRNRRILEADPALAKRLANLAAKGGGPALVLSHLIAIAPAAGISLHKFRTANAQRKAAREEAAQEVYVDPVIDPDIAFGKRVG